MFLYDRLEAALTLLLEAGAAVDRTITAGLEGNLGGTAAAIADYIVHGTIGVAVLVAAGSTTGSAASGATAGLVLEALLGEESLLGSSEHEFGAAVTAGQSLVLIHGWKTSLKILHPHPSVIRLLPLVPVLGGKTIWRNEPFENLAGLTEALYHVFPRLYTLEAKKYFHYIKRFVCKKLFRMIHIVVFCTFS